jgi:tetratricopeptide (TPR) repeat protein
MFGKIKLRLTSLTLLLLSTALLNGCTAIWGQRSSPADPTPNYNKGVEAYIAQDYTQALAHWQKAIARQESPSAYNNAGYLLYYGLGTSANPTEAVTLWQQVAKQGHGEAQWHLAIAYSEGKGVPKNLVEAYAWHLCAIANAKNRPEGPEAGGGAEIAQSAQATLGKLLPQLSKAEAAQGKQLGDRYIEQYGKPYWSAPAMP